jgi:hypothetical protein
MDFEFKINEELAAIAVTATELLSISRGITALVNNSDFLQQFNEIISEINKSYAVVGNSFAPFYALGSEVAFTQSFNEYHEAFKGSYLLEVSKPRRYCDNVYDAYIQLQQTKEAKSGFPLLKRNFKRLDTFYDKWVTNDNLLAMSIDGALKLQNRLLNEIAEIKQKDEEDAYIVFSSALEDFREYLRLIKINSDNVSTLIAQSSTISDIRHTG